MTKFKTLFIFLFIILFSFNISFGWTEDNSYVNKFQHYDYLRSIALKKGSVKVITKLDVPGIEELTFKSNGFKTGIEELTFKSKKFKKELNEVLFQQDRLAADAALENAISAISHYVLLNLEGFSHRINHTYATIPFLALDVSLEALDAIYYMPEVIFVQEDKLISLEEPQKTEGTEIGSPALDDSTELIGAEDAWDLGFTGDGWYVAVLDTGILSSHEMFTGKTIVEQCYSLLGDCPNGLTQMSGPGAARHFNGWYHNSWDHGTHVSGIAAGNNQNGFFGVAKDSNIIACNIFSNISGSPRFYFSDLDKGLEYVYLNRTTYNIASVNMSLAGGYYQTYCDSTFSSAATAISNLRNVGIAPVIATGNDGNCFGTSFPACIDPGIAVGASSKSDVEPSFNNWSDTLMEFFAPGVSIRSATGDSNTSYQYWSGTSMATPHVAGGWAILKQLLPNTGVTEIENALVSTGTKIGTVCSSLEKPRINIGTTLQLLGVSLTTSASTGGTIDPVPGTYLYESNEQVSISAIPDDYHVFSNWSGDASGTNNPIVITMQANTSITANFRPVFAPSNFNGIKSTNRNLFQIENINTLSWIANPDNQGINIEKYRIYLINGEDITQLVEINIETFTYIHRQAGKDPQEYAIVGVLNDGRIGYASFIIVQ